MKHRKQILSGLLAGMMLMGLAACGQSGGAPSSAGTQSTDQVQEEGTAPAPDNSGADNAVGGNGNVLVVYYSATGNTEEAAGDIADLTGGTMFELEPAIPIPMRT